MDVTLYHNPRCSKSRDDDHTDAAWCAILAKNPSLIERPIVVTHGKAALGRPPERVLEILS